MAKKASHHDLPAALHKWATEEMHFQCSGKHVNKPPPTVKDLAEICKGEMESVWSFVIKNIYSPQTVRKIQGNLLLKHKQIVPYMKSYKVKYGSDDHYSQEKADLFDKHRVLIAEIKSMRTTIGHLEKDLTQTKLELLEIEQKYQSTFSQVRDLKRKSTILHVHSHQVEQKVQQMDEFSNRLSYMVKNLKERSKSKLDEKCFQGDILSSESQKTLVSPTTKDVMACCESIYDFLHEMLKGTYGTDTKSIGQHKNRLWSKLESVVGEHSPNKIMQSLLIIAREATYSLQQKTARIDIKKDAEQLRFKYENKGQLVDVSTQPPLLKSVHQLLQEKELQQIKNFVEREKYKNNVEKLRPHLSHIFKLRDDTLAQLYHGHDPAAIALAKQLFETEVQIASTHGAIQCLKMYKESLKESIATALQTREVLYNKYQKIKYFQQMTDAKQNRIRVLIKQNLSARSRLLEQQAELLNQAERVFEGQEEAMLELTKALKDSVKEEIAAFTVLSLPNLLFTLLDSVYKIAVKDLSINRLSANPNAAGGQMIKKLLKALEFPTYKAPEDLLIKVIDLQSEMKHLESSLQLHQTSAAQNITTIVHKADDLRKQSLEHDKQQLEQLLPVLQRLMTELGQSTTDCLQLKDLTQEWWTQPAQDTVPWMTVDDKTLKQWKDQWTLAATRLRQLQLK